MTYINTPTVPFTILIEQQTRSFPCCAACGTISGDIKSDDNKLSRLPREKTVARFRIYNISMSISSHNKILMAKRTGTFPQLLKSKVWQKK